MQFSDDHMYMFYVARTPRSRDRIDFDNEDGSLEQTTLTEIFPLAKGRKLFYWFDFGDDWKFSFERTRAAPQPAERGRDIRAWSPCEAMCRTSTQRGIEPTFGSIAFLANVLFGKQRTWAGSVSCASTSARTRRSAGRAGAPAFVASATGCRGNSRTSCYTSVRSWVSPVNLTSRTRMWRGCRR